MAITTLTIDDLYSEITELAREEAVSTRELWNDMVEEVVEGHVDLGELDSDQDTEGMKEILRAKWNNFKDELAEEEEAAKSEFEVDTTTAALEDDKEDKDKDEDEEEEKETNTMDNFGSSEEY